MKRLNKNNDANIKNKMKKQKRKNGIHGFELFFNVVSLLFAIAVGLYFGGRSFYYYSMQSNRREIDQFTLNGTITSNTKTVTEGDGLHQDTDGYYFKGNVENNYVKFANRLFRVIRINNDGTVRLIDDNISTEFMWGDDGNYIDSNVDKWLDKKEGYPGSGIYYDTLPYVEDFLVKTEYNVPTFDGKSVTPGKDKIESYVTTLSIKDYSTANGKNSYLNNGRYFWLVGLDNDGQNLYVSEDGSLLGGSTYESYGIRAVITMKKDMAISGGSGTKDDPYYVNQGKKTNLVNTTIKFPGGYKWKVVSEDSEAIRIVYTEPVTLTDKYSTTTSMFNPNEKNSLANALNTTYYGYLIMKEKFLDQNIYTGEVSADTSLDFYNYYGTNVSCKVGILSMFDYKPIDADDYYLSNTTSTVGSMVYVYHNYGSLGEAKVTETKKVYPVLRLSKSAINFNSGNNDDGYEVQ